MSLWKVKFGRDIQEVTFSILPVKNALQAIIRGQVEKECGGHYDFRGDRIRWRLLLVSSQSQITGYLYQKGLNCPN
jgi:hypothetical protein